MAWQIPFENTGTPIDLTTTDSLYVGEDIYVAAIVRGTGSDHTVVVDGTVAAGGEPVIILGNAGETGNTIHIGESGKVVSLGLAATPIAAIGILGNSGNLVNEGEIVATVNRGAGVGFAGGDATSVLTMTNSGTITTGSIGVLNGAAGGTFTLRNSGSIIAGEGAITEPAVGTLNFGAFVSVGTVGSQIVESLTKDTIINSGKMVGDIWLGGGDDLYDGRLGTVVAGEVRGEGGNDRIYTGAGNDTLLGGDGNDTLMGGAGADYLSGGAGIDRAAYTTAKAGLTVSLANSTLNTGDAKGDTFNSIENLTGSDFSDNLFGTNGINVISGGAGNDVIKGYNGNDTLAGGAGKDVFIFSSALNAASNVDTITDFIFADDTVQLDNAVFTALTTLGTLAAAAFRANTTGLAQDASDRIIYETDTGELYYDFNGNAAGGGVLFAKLDPGLGITNADFVVI
jgi:Ca2+-binding RTX toxin-like protein